MKPKILIMAESYLRRDPRVQVQVEALKDDYDVTCCGLVHPDVEGVNFIPFGTIYSSKLSKIIGIGPNRLKLAMYMKLKRYEDRYFCRKEIVEMLPKLSKHQFDLILCNDIDLLPLASKLKDQLKVPLYLDAHEYTPRQWDGDKKFKSKLGYWDSLVKKYASHVDVMTNVCQSIATEYETVFGLVNTALVYNAPFPNPELSPTPTNPQKIRMVHHGGLNRNRSPEKMIELMDALDNRFELEFILVNNDPGYLKQFKLAAAHNSRIHFRDPVATRDIPAAINQYDIGLFLLDPASFNYRNALPNKFFEFIQARLAIAIWPSHEMKRIVDDHDLGIVSDDFTVSAMVQKLNAVDVAMIDRFKQNSDAAAKIYNAENSISVIQENVKKLLGLS